jgi:stage II sporulation protein D
MKSNGGHRLIQLGLMFIVTSCLGCEHSPSTYLPTTAAYTDATGDDNGVVPPQPNTATPLPELKIPLAPPRSTSHQATALNCPIRVELQGQILPLKLTSRANWIVQSGRQTPQVQRAVENLSIKIQNQQLILGAYGTYALPVEIRYESNHTNETFELGSRRYHGVLRFVLDAQGTCRIVNELELETYLVSVIDSEMPAEFGPEARKAQAILARTYALAHIRDKSHASYADLTDGVRHQKYLGASFQDAGGRWLTAETLAGQQAVKATTDLVLTYNNKIFVAYYCACCGGHTLDGDEVYRTAENCYQGKPDPWCSAYPQFHWKKSFNRSEGYQKILDYLKENNLPFQNLKGMSRVTAQSPDKLPAWKISDDIRQLTITAIDLRRCWAVYGLLSPRFKIHLKPDEIEVEGQGSGHGVGLCQWGARGMDHAGYKAEDILKFYYQQVEIRNWKTLQSPLPQK